MTATHAVVFECKHRAILLDEEYGDGSAWCQQCGEFRCYDDQPERGVGVTGDHKPGCIWHTTARDECNCGANSLIGLIEGVLDEYADEVVEDIRGGVTGDTPSPLDLLRELVDETDGVLDVEVSARNKAALAQVEALAEAAQAVWDRGGHPHQLDQLHAALVPFAAHKDTA